MARGGEGGRKERGEMTELWRSRALGRERDGECMVQTQRAQAALGEARMYCSPLRMWRVAPRCLVYFVSY
jgi:hypothetical protein